MNTFRSRLSLILPVLFAIAAALSYWLATQQHSRPLGWLAIGFSVLTAGAVVYTLRQRQTNWAQSARAWQRLSYFALIAVSLAVAATVVWLAQARAYGLVHPTHIPPTCRPEDEGLREYVAVSFPSSDGLTLRGWYAPARNGAAVILVHGLGGNRCEMLADAGLLAAHGYGALLFDLRNSGESEGDTTTLGLLEVNDVRGAVDFVLAQPGMDANRIGLMGHSMGGATVIRAGARIPEVSAIVAESAYTSIEDNTRSSLVKLTGLPAFPFAPLVVFFGERESGLDITQVRPVDDIASISPRPVLIVHGEEDETIAVANAYALYAAAREPKELYVIAEAGHCCLPQIGADEYIRRVIGFFERYLLKP